MTTEPEHHKTYTIIPGPKTGIVTPEFLEAVAAVARKQEVPMVKITSAQRLALIGHGPEDLPEIWRALGLGSGPKKAAGIHYIQSCPGARWCKYGRQDSLALAGKLEEALLSMDLPAKTKVGVAGCPFNCCECYVRDLGVFGKKHGWTLVFGGNGGGLPRIGDVIAEGLADDEVVDLARKCLEYYRENARKMERTSRFMRRTTIECFKEAVVG